MGGDCSLQFFSGHIRKFYFAFLFQQRSQEDAQFKRKGHYKSKSSTTCLRRSRTSKGTVNENCEDTLASAASYSNVKTYIS